MNLVTKSIIIVAAAATGVLTATVPSAQATNQASCVDGSVRSNIKVTWITSKDVTVGTVANKPLCEDVPVFFSSYTMPDNYNGRGFYQNPTASPQTIFGNETVVLKKGATKPTAISITLPEACKHVQVDVYYGPKIDIVGTEGHGDQYISGKILEKTQDTCAPVTPAAPTAPAVPAPEAQTPETPAPQVVIPVVPVELPRTGLSASSMSTLGVLVAAAAYAVAFSIGKRH